MFEPFSCLDMLFAVKCASLCFSIRNCCVATCALDATANSLAYLGLIATVTYKVIMSLCGFFCHQKMPLSTTCIKGSELSSQKMHLEAVRHVVNSVYATNTSFVKNTQAGAPIAKVMKGEEVVTLANEHHGLQAWFKLTTFNLQTRCFKYFNAAVPSKWQSNAKMLRAPTRTQLGSEKRHVARARQRKCH